MRFRGDYDGGGLGLRFELIADAGDGVAGQRGCVLPVLCCRPNLTGLGKPVFSAPSTVLPQWIRAHPVEGGLLDGLRWLVATLQVETPFWRPRLFSAVGDVAGRDLSNRRSMVQWGRVWEGVYPLPIKLVVSEANSFDGEAANAACFSKTTGRRACCFVFFK